MKKRGVSSMSNVWNIGSSPSGVLTEAYKKKQIRAIGVSNYCSKCLECLAGTEVFPMVNQVQLHVGMGYLAAFLRVFTRMRGVIVLRSTSKMPRGGSDPEGFRSFAETHQIHLQVATRKTPQGSKVCSGFSSRFIFSDIKMYQQIFQLVVRFVGYL